MIEHIFNECGCRIKKEECKKHTVTQRVVCPEHKTNIDTSIHTCEKCRTKTVGKYVYKKGDLCAKCQAQKTIEHSAAYRKKNYKKPQKINEGENPKTSVAPVDYGSATGTKPDCGFYVCYLQDAIDSKEKNPVIPCKTCKIYAPVNALRAENYIRVSDICTSNITELSISPEVRRLGK